jgi:hypothetical protein
MERKMKEVPDDRDAELMLRLYELRREEKLRLARDWVIREFHADSLDDFFKRFPPGTKENDYFRMAVSYWDMAASIVNHGLIHEGFFFESNGEFWIIWMKIARLIPERRSSSKNPLIYHHLETLAGKYEKWMEKRAPEALAVLGERIKALSSKKDK